MKTPGNSLSYTYEYEVKYHSIKQVYKVVRYKIAKTTRSLLAKQTIHKNIPTKLEAEQIVYQLTRNKK